jgi:hypothetical protein
VDLGTECRWAPSPKQDGGQGSEAGFVFRDGFRRPL